MAKKQRGGKRQGAGAPSASDPKVPIRFGLEDSVVIKLGGTKKVQKMAPDLLKREAAKITSNE